MDWTLVLWLLPAFVAGGAFGVVVAGLCRSAGAADLHAEIG